MSSTPEVLRNKVAEAREREQDVEEEGGAHVVFFPTALNCHVRQSELAGQKAQHLDCEPKVNLKLRSAVISNASLCDPIIKPGDLLPHHTLKTTPNSGRVEIVARLDESSVLATLERKADKRKRFPFRSDQTLLLLKSSIALNIIRRVWDSLVKRRVEAESWEQEAREKDLSLAEVRTVIFLISKARVPRKEC